MARATVRNNPGSFAIELEGPFFTSDPRLTLRQNIRALMDRLAQVGEEEVRQRASVTHNGGVPELVRGRTRAIGGRRWAVSAVISLDTGRLAAAEAIRAQAIMAGRHVGTTRKGRHIGTTRGIEGTAHPFSRTAADLRRVVADIDLTKGLG